MLSDDYLAVPAEGIADITSVLTLVGGKPVHGDAEFKDLAPPLPPAMPDWSPVRSFDGYHQRTSLDDGRLHALAAAGGSSQACAIHGHAHARAWAAAAPVADETAFWGALGCSCWAF